MREPMPTKITTGSDLGKLLKTMCDRMVTDAYRKLAEAPVQVEKGQTLLMDEPDEDEAPAEAPPAETGYEKDAKTMESGEVDTDAVIEKLNTIRSGKSFRDSAVKDSLKKYIDELDTAEKTALFAFLKGVAQITTGEVAPESAVEPSAPEPDITMKKGGGDAGKGGKKSFIKKPTVTHLPAGGGKKKPSAEDTTPPITAKKK